MQRAIPITTVLSLLAVSQASAGYVTIGSVDQTIRHNIQFSLFHDTTAGGNNGNNALKPRIELGSGGPNFWDMENGKFQLFIDVYDGSTKIATGVGVSTNMVFSGGSFSSGIAGSITWYLDTSLGGSGSKLGIILTNMGKAPDSNGKSVVTTHFHENYAFADDLYWTSHPMDHLTLWGSDSVTAGNENGIDQPGLGVDLGVTFDGFVDLPSPGVVPEPSSMLLLILGCIALAGFAWKRRNLGLAA